MEDHNIEDSASDPVPARGSRRRWLQLGLGIAIWVGLIVTVVVGWDEVKDELARAGLMFPATILMITVGSVAAARGWAELNPVEMRRRSMVGFLAAQPAKYLPIGGAALAVSQVSLSSSETSSRRDVGWAFLVHAGTLVTAGTIVALLMIPADDVPGWVKVSVLVAAVLMILCTRQSVVGWLIRQLSRILPRFRHVGAIPDTPTLWRTVGWSLIPFLLAGVSFALLLTGRFDPMTLLSTAGVFSAAWVVGFIVVPLPAGLGLREAVLVALLPGFAPAYVLGISLIHRFASLVAELLVLAVVSRSAFMRGVD